MPCLSKFSSLTHQHLFACINTIIYHVEPIAPQRLIRILDLGCGNGIMLASFVKELRKKNPAIEFEFYGLDVDDSLVQQAGYFEKTISILNETDSTTNWANFLKLVKSSEPWPFANNYFDFIISNQVMEHVADHYFCFSQIQRTLTEDGFSFNLYPLKHVLQEWHLFIPLAHKFSNWSKTYKWIKFWSHLGIGTYKWHKANGLMSSVNEYAEKHADYMSFQVNYLTTRNTAAIAKKAGLKSSFDFTHLYYVQKIRSIFRLSLFEQYRRRHIFKPHSFYFFFLKHISSITLVLRKKESKISGVTRIKK